MVVFDAHAGEKDSTEGFILFTSGRANPGLP